MTDSHNTAEHQGGHDDSHGHDSHGGVTKYLIVFLALCVLTGGSFMTYFDFWHEMFSVSASRAFMMAVSCSKALLVMLFFMHLKWEANWKYVLTFPAAFMSIFLVVMLIPDIGMRTHYYNEDRWTHAAEPDPDQPGAHDTEGGHAGHGDGEHAGHEAESETH